MKNRIKHKIIKRKIKNILKEFEKYFTIKKKSLWMTTSYFEGRCHFEILEEPNVKIGIKSIGINEKQAWFYMQPKYTYLRFHPIDCKEENTSHDINEFIFRLKQTVNNFVNAMKDDDESEEEFWENFHNAKEYKEVKQYLSGFERDEYHELKAKVDDFLKNKVDYEKIYEIIFRYGRDFFMEIGSMNFYPNWEKCDDEYLDKFEEDVRQLKIASFQWRSMRKNMPKKEQKTWTVYTKHGNISLYNYNKL